MGFRVAGDIEPGKDGRKRTRMENGVQSCRGHRTRKRRTEKAENGKWGLGLRDRQNQKKTDGKG